MKRKLFWPALTCISLLISSCCDEIWVGEQEVDVQPLYDTRLELEGVEKISDIVDESMFDSVQIHEPTYLLARWVGPTDKLPEIHSASGFNIAISLLDSTDVAQEAFSIECSSSEWASVGIEYGGEESNQYCISQVQRLREPPDGFCQPTNHYVSHVIFQKGRLVIIIEESIYSEPGHNLVFSKDAVISKLAEELAK